MNKIVHNAETNEVMEIPLTVEEIDLAKKTKTEIEKMFAEDKAKRESRLAILEKLGLTEEEARLLLG